MRLTNSLYPHFLALESDLIPYSACKSLPARVALVLAPHPDDEVFGCGGAIASHVALGQPVCVVVLTDGALYGDALMRQHESCAAAAVLGYGLPEFWAYPDRGLVYAEALVQRLVDKIAITNSDLVYAPSPWEIHPDHRQTNRLAIEAVRRTGAGVRLAFYEVGAPLRPNVLLDLTPLLAIKEAAMRCFGSQLQQQDYVGHIQALNRYRSYTLSAAVTAAEAYWVLTAQALDTVWRNGMLAMVSPGGLDDPAQASAQADTGPLVSILIRSTDGQFLPEALDSVALQAYSNIEVLVAHTGIAALPARCGPFALRSLVCPAPIDSGAVANQLMQAAQGNCLLFLDEDDWLMPEHVAKLVTALQRQPHAQAAFTGVGIAQQAGWPTGETCMFSFGNVADMTPVRTPVHAVMFDARLQHKGCQFDDSEGALAAWGLWTQIAGQTFMAQVPGTSAAYRNRMGRGTLGQPVPTVVALPTLALQAPPPDNDPLTPERADLSTPDVATAFQTMTTQNLQTLQRDAPHPLAMPVMVSVLIRTTNRASLVQAIASVAAQSFTHWEIVVANASGQPLTPLLPEFARQVTRLIEPGIQLGRSAAANALLDAATGKYAMFLDDDDQLLPAHLQKLVSAFNHAHEAGDQLVACYSDVQATIAENGDEPAKGHLYQRDFDPLLLQLQNYLPIHSVLFRLDIARREVACRFDEGLALFEDWDFWLQLAAKGAFKRIAGVSALYALNTDSGSGHTQAQSTQRKAALMQFGERQLGRWGAEGVAKLIGWQGLRLQDEAHAQQSTDSLKTQLAQASQDIARLDQDKARTLATIDSLQTQLDQASLDISRLAQDESHALQAIDSLQNQLAHDKAHAQQISNSLQIQLTQASEDITRLAQAEALAVQNIISLQTQLMQASQDITRLTQDSVQERDHLHSQLQHAGTALDNTQQSLQKTEQVLQEVRAHEFAQHMELEKLGRVRLEHLHHIDGLNARLLATYQSRSWQLTRPLRGATRLLRWLQTPKPLRLARNGLLAVRGEVRRHGVTGFARRLPHFLRHARTYAALLTSPLPEARASAFSAQAPSVQALRLHPDLTAVTETIDASISVVIPTYNAGTEFKWLLRKLMTQRGLKNLEVVIVDSGSSDNTVLWARQAGCRVVEITQAEFTHSHSRNLGAAHAASDYVLFMVQDAYPVGDYWAYGMLRYLLDHADSGLVAASCSEYPRSDSDIMYDAMINVHYRFLGCHEHDRIGDFQGSDHMALRSLGQLSDVACLISRKMFGEYGYQGDYAEDLDLGIRLIKDGHKVAMLASVKVVHSHNRAAFYYLKRSYVDVIFLVGMFEDFTFPPVESVPGLLAGIVSGAGHVSALLPTLEDAAAGMLLSDVLANWIEACKVRCQVLKLDGTSTMGDVRLDSYVDGLTQRLNAADMDSLARGQAQRFMDTFFARLEHFNTFAADVYGPHDAGLREALQHVVRKTFAASAGSALGFMYMDKLSSPGADQPMVDTINQELRVGV